MKTETTGRKHWGLVLLTALMLTAWLPLNVLADQAKTIQVNLNESVVVTVSDVAKLAIAEPSVADVASLSEKDIKEISIIGKKVGVTTLTVVHSEGKPTELYRIEVGNVSQANTIQQLIGSGVSVHMVGDAFVLEGIVEDEIVAQRAAQIATAYKAPVINLIEVKNPRQIKITTRVVEVNSDAIKNVGLRWFGGAGEIQYALDYNGGGSIIHGLVQPASSSGTTPTSPNSLDIGLDVILQLLQSKNFARVLSEPTLVTLSGKEASFLVGQEVPIVQQLPQSFTVEFKEVGVRMKVTPTADSQNQINTKIHAEVSQIVGAGAQGIPIIGAKTADSFLQLKDGQTMVIGGLLENNVNRDYLRKVPWLADIPLFGFLFRQKEFDQTQREVLFFLKTEVVKDVEALVAGAAQTKVMKDWNAKATSGKELLPRDHAKDDWGLHNPSNLGMPEAKPHAEDKPAATKAGKEPSTNFETARPTAQ